MSADLNTKIYVAGHRGMVGSAIVRNLKSEGIYKYCYPYAHAELDLTNQAAVKGFF
jgi:GDP-L-fucose synthase